MALDLSPVHIKLKRRIGRLNTNPIFEVLTTGGLYLNILGKGAGFEVIATGPHQAVARHISMERHPGIEWTELSKSDYVDPQDYLFLLPKYRELAERFRSIQAERE